MAKRRKIRVEYSSLKNEWGWSHLGDGYIEIDKKAKGKKLLEIIIHEAFHIMHPAMEEEEVEEKSILLTNTLWHEGFRKIDADTSRKLQDGKK